MSVSRICPGGPCRGSILPRYPLVWEGQAADSLPLSCPSVYWRLTGLSISVHSQSAAPPDGLYYGRAEPGWLGVRRPSIFSCPARMPRGPTRTHRARGRYGGWRRACRALPAMRGRASSASGIHDPVPSTRLCRSALAGQRLPGDSESHGGGEPASGSRAAGGPC
jgi:hypothetical protein